MFTKQPSTSPHRFLFLVVFALVFLVPVVTVVAQADPPVRTSPTQAPTVTTGAFQANPTREPDLPIRANPTQPPAIDDVVANPTDPPREEIDDVVANPTEVPEREIDDVVANPTEVPEREIDDVVANPTEAPAIDDEAIPTTGTVRVIKRDCPLGVVEDAFLSDYLTICTENHDGVEFVLNDVDGAQLGVTNGGVVEWTGVDPGVFNITETLPAGYTDPIVFCGYTESPGGGVQHPSRQESAGGIVAGTFPDAMFEFVCYWMNLKTTGQAIPGADDIASREERDTADFLLMKHVCPNDIPPGQGPAYYLEHCTEVVDGIEFTVSHGNGGATKAVSGGTAEWSGIPLGPFTVDEDVPVQFGEPIVFCGWTAIYEGTVYDAFAQLTPSTGGVVELEASIPGAYHFCYYFNVKGVGDLVDPDSVASNLVTRKWTCPDGTSQNQRDRDYYVQRCELMLEPVEFTVSSAKGDDTKATSGGFAEWVGLPLGEFTLTEAIPSGYGAPVVFCGWYAEWGGFHYDAFPQLVILAAANVYEGEITIPNTDYFCDVFNIAGELDDFQANPTEVPGIDDFQGNATAGTMRLEKRSCPLGVVETATLAEYLTLCPQLHDGVDFTLETAAGIGQDTTAMGQAQWTGVPAGAFELQEDIPAGYKDPIVFCGYTESPGGGVQHPALQESTGGLVEGAFPENTIFEYVCYWMNLKATGQVGTGPGSVANPGGEGGSSVVVVKKRTCPFGTPLDLEMSAYAEQCTGELDGVQFTVSHANGSSTKPTDDGEAQWQALPLGPFTVQEAIPAGYDEPVITCFMVAFADGGDWVLGTYFEARPAPDGLIAIELDPPDDLDLPDIESTHTTCTAYNMPLGPGSFAQAEDLTNSLLVRKWICPGSTIQGDDLYDMQDQCELSTMPVAVTLTNDDGESTQPTDPAWTQWGDVPLGEFTLQETIPDGVDEPIAYCGWTAFYEGAIYDSFPHPVPSPGGLVEGEIVVPNTSYFCDLFNIATGTGIGGPDSVVANLQDESNTLVAHTWFCEAGTPADAHLLDYFEHCQLAETPVEFTLTNDEGVFVEATAGGTAEWNDVPLGEFTLKETLPAGYDVLVVWCGWTAFYNGAVYDAFSQPAPEQDGLVIREISVPNTHFRCDFIDIAVEIDDFQANPTEADEIDDFQANPPESAEPWFRADARVCPAGFDLNVHWMDVFEACDLPIDGVEFTFTDASGSSTQALTGTHVQWNQVGIGEGQTVELVEDYPSGYTDPFVLCSSWPAEAGDPFDWYYEPVAATGGAISVTPNLDEGDGPLGVIPQGEGYDCKFFHFAVEGIAGADDFQANPTQAPTAEPIDDLQANPTEVPGDNALLVPAQVYIHEYLCDPAWDPYAEDQWGWFHFLNGCSHPNPGAWQVHTFEYTLTDGGAYLEQVANPLHTGANPLVVALGAITITSTVPDGFGDPVTMCTDSGYGPVLDQPPAGAQQWGVGDSLTIDMALGDSKVCQFFHVAEEPLSTSTWLGVWQCPDGTASGQTLDAYLTTCPEGLNGLEVNLGMWNGGSLSGSTVDGVAHFPSTHLGHHFLEPELPAGMETLEVYCGIASSPGGEIQGPAPQVLTLTGQARGFLEVPGTEFACNWFATSVEIDDFTANPTERPTEEPIDDFQANPTEEPEIDDFQANPVEPGTLIVHLWACPPAYDPLAGSAPDDCTESLNGVTFDLVNHAEGEPDFQATTGDESDGTAVFEPQPGTYSLIEQIPDGYDEPFLWNCSGLDNPALPEPPISTINFFRIVIASGQDIECDWMNVPAGAGFGGPGDLRANPTEAPEIDDIQANPTEEPEIDDVTANPARRPSTVARSR